MTINNSAMASKRQLSRLAMKIHVCMTADGAFDRDEWANVRRWLMARNLTCGDVKAMTGVDVRALADEYQGAKP